MLFIATGGTIDKQPAFLRDGRTFDHDSKIFGRTHLPEIIRKAQFFGEHSIHILFMIDSLDMTDDHRKAIGAAIQESDEEEIIITHGTDTMPETARFLQLNSQLASRTIVLTGAMIPYSMGPTSDAVENVSEAIKYAQGLTSGVYVAMDGHAFDADNVWKDKEAGVFRSLK